MMNTYVPEVKLSKLSQFRLNPLPKNGKFFETGFN